MKRYALSLYRIGQQDEGEWVKHEDAQAEIDRLTQQLNEANRKIGLLWAQQRFLYEKLSGETKITGVWIDECMPDATKEKK